MQIYQPINGYCYNSDTYCLYDFICQNLKKFKNIQGNLLDIGSGSGILGLLIKNEYEKLNLDACEIQEEFSFFSQKNAKINNIDMTMYNCDYSQLNAKNKYDIIVSNPPFYPSSVVQTNNANIKIARYNDNLPLQNFILETSNNLKEKGKFFFCYDVKLLNDIIILLNEYKLNIEAIQFLHPKRDKNATLVMIYARKNSKSLMNILKPFIMFENDEFSNKMKNIYEKCNTHSIKANYDRA